MQGNNEDRVMGILVTHSNLGIMLPVLFTGKNTSITYSHTYFQSLNKKVLLYSTPILQNFKQLFRQNTYYVFSPKQTK